jgi:hypothetical protein
MNLRAWRTLSAYSRMASVPGSAANQSSRSPKSTSLPSPRDTKLEKPIRRERAQSSTAVTSAPDCATKASRPGSAATGAKLAFSPTAGASSPTQLGPRIRSRWGRAASSIAWRKLRPPGEGASSPALSTTAALHPCAPSTPTMAGTVAAGVQITASSGACGRSATLRATGRPSSSSYFGLTGQIGPLKPPLARFDSTVAPTLPDRAEAPITATDRGEKKKFRFRTLILSLPAISRRIRIRGGVFEVQADIA